MQADVCAAPGVAHSLPAGMASQKITGVKAEKTCTNYLIVTAPRIATRAGLHIARLTFDSVVTCWESSPSVPLLVILTAAVFPAKGRIWRAQPADHSSEYLR